MQGCTIRRLVSLARPRRLAEPDSTQNSIPSSTLNHFFFQLSLTFTFIFQLKTLSHFYFSADWGILWTLHPAVTHSQACHLFWRSSGGCCGDDHVNDGDDDHGDDNDGDDDDDEFSK